MNNLTLEIVLVTGGMPFGPETMRHKSLGGSEAAALHLAKALKANGHIVTVFTNLPPEGAPDAIASGGIGPDQVRYVDISQYPTFITSTEVDLLIALRSPELLALNHQARFAVLWAHDLATYNGPAKTLPTTAWNMDEIWCVSDWQADQWAEVTGYPRSSVKVLRNAIIPHPEIIPFVRSKNQLVYAARPERGLEVLVRPGGIMSRLPEFRLVVCTYDNFPPQMAGYYNQLFSWAKELPNVEFLGSLTNVQVRQLLWDSAAYLYPTDFEETSCILAQEAMDAQCPFLHTDRGALAETLGDYVPGSRYTSSYDWNSDEFCQDWANFVRAFVPVPEDQVSRGLVRYWEDAAGDVERMFYDLADAKRNHFTNVWSLVEDSDVVPAVAYMDSLQDAGITSPALRELRLRLTSLYPYLFGLTSFAEYYERYFVREDSKGARQRRSMVGNPRFEAIAAEIAQTAPDATILDYGCAEGVIVLDLAERFPTRHFVGIDFAATNVALCKRYAAEMGLRNVEFYVGSTEDWPLHFNAHAVICSEVLEHVERPWEVAQFLENKIGVGGRVILTVPMGPWEAIGLYDKEQWNWRAHIWHINKWMLRTMFGDKEDCRMSSLPGGAMPDGRALGHLLFSYAADHGPVHPIAPLDKAYRHRPRETVTAAMVVNNADMLMLTLKSIHQQVQVFKIHIHADDAETIADIARVADRFAANHPWAIVRTRSGRKLEPGVYGFDDARNDSVKDIETDWILWIDSDEYVSGDFRKYLRHNAFDAYAISQHHFSCDPRGAPPQLDRPARLYRADRGFAFYGKVHEHAEKGMNNGPGFAMLLGDVDIGHVGYVNEDIRRTRFSRNFPFLEWDHQVNPDRNLSKFLWLRDIVQRMRYHREIGDNATARRLAEEAVAYYAAEWKDWTAPGMGGEAAIQYHSEALAFLGRGMALGIQLDIENEKAMLSGVFESAEETAEAIKRMLQDKFKVRRSRYWS